MKIAVLSFAHERAETYARLLRDIPGVDLVAAGPEATVRPDAVVVAGQIGHRRELVEYAAALGAHVLCEQPLARGQIDADAMVEACAAAGVRLSLVSPARYSDAFDAVRRGLADGVIGRLTTVYGSCETPVGTADAGVGALAANAPLLLDLVDAVLEGEGAEQVYAQGNSVLSGQRTAESAALVTVRYPSGAVAALDCGWNAAPVPTGPALTFVGDRASVEYTARTRLLGGYDIATDRERWEPGGVEPYSAMLHKFVSSCADGSRSGPDGKAGLRAMRIVQAAYESMETGQPVDLT